MPYCRALSYWPAEKYPLDVWFESPDVEATFWKAADLWREATGGFVRFEAARSEAEADVRIAIEFVEGTARGDAVVRRMGEELHYARIRVEPGEEDSVMVMAHEMGHALGIAGHSPVPGDLMFKTGNESGMLLPRDVNTFWIAHRRQLRRRH